MFVDICGEPLQVVLEEEDAQELRVSPRHRDIPGQHHRQIEQNARHPDGSSQQRPLASQRNEGKDDGQRKKRRHRPFRQCGRAVEEVEVKEPEFLVRLVPRIPAQHANAERRRKLHIRRGAARKRDNARAARRDQSSIQLPAGPEAPDMQVDQRYKDERKARRGQARRPVVHAKLLERKHRPPVVQRRLLQPWLAVKNRCDVVVAPQHFARNLRVARFIRAHQPEAVTSENRHQSVEKEERREEEADSCLDGETQRWKARREGLQSGKGCRRVALSVSLFHSRPALSLSDEQERAPTARLCGLPYDESHASGLDVAGNRAALLQILLVILLGPPERSRRDHLRRDRLRILMTRIQPRNRLLR